MTDIAAVLREIAASEDGEIVAEGTQVYIGPRRTNWGVLKALLRCGAVSASDVSSIMQRYVINESGRAIMRRPELAKELANAYLSHEGPFTIRNDRVVPLEAPKPGAGE